MTYIKTYKELIVWKKSVALVKEIYILTDDFPKEELYGITSQMRRATISIPSNIAEGYGRNSQKEYLQFYAIAYGSALELETQLIISKELNLTKRDKFISSEILLEEILKMLNSMMYTIKNKTTRR